MSAREGPAHATAIVPVKRFSAANQRLSDVLGPSERARLAAAMLSDVLGAIGRSELIDRLLIVSREPRLAGVASAHGARLLDDPGDSSHSRAAGIGIAAAIGDGARSVALLPGDCPLLEASELDSALAALGEGIVGVIPDRHGSGTNGLLCCPPDLIEPAFGPDSRERHLELAERAGARGEVIEIHSLALDLDTGGDLEALRALVRSGKLGSSATAEALEGINSGPARRA
jgi:2-phospho-L-lactate guanylyltransferase